MLVGDRGVMAGIEHAVRQALEARKRAAECIDNRAREEWLMAARSWDELITEYQQLQNSNGDAKSPDPSRRLSGDL